MAHRQADIHFHALPGIDDGPRTIADAVELARLAAADGTSDVVATPHVRDVLAMGILSELPERVQELRDELADRGIDLQVQVGGELDEVDVSRLSEDELEMLAQGAGADAPRGWLLYEPPWSRRGAEYLECAGELRRQGFGLVIAHPERSPLFRNPEGETSLRLLREAGARTQITAGSLAGRHGEGAWNAARRWLAEGLVDLVASDAHGPGKAPGLRAARREIAERTDDESARRLVVEGPLAVLDGVAVPGG
jgi:protein-tyrosine phosphatase